MKPAPWGAGLAALMTSCLVAAPLAVALQLGHARTGAAAALGAYLWTIGQLKNRHPLAVRVSLISAALLGVAGATGALAGGRLWLLVALCPVWAGGQALADSTRSGFRMPTAMAALCFLLSAMGGGSDPVGAVRQGALVLGGALWMALWEFARYGSGASVRSKSWVSPMKALKEAWARSRSFVLLLSVPTTLSAAGAGLFQVSHGAWAATTVLRVLRPEASATRARGGRRIAGTVGGALVAAVLLTLEPHTWTAVITLVVFLTAMQLVGPARYGFYTFFLTLVALELGAVDRPSGWQAALVRVGLTCVGTGIAVASGFLFERVRGHAHRPIGAGNDDHAG